MTLTSPSPSQTMVQKIFSKLKIFDNLFLVVKLVSGLNSELEGTLGGLKKAYVTTPEENGVRTGLVLRPHSTSLVLNSTPGFLQFFDTETKTLSTEVRTCAAECGHCHHNFMLGYGNYKVNSYNIKKILGILRTKKNFFKLNFLLLVVTI